MILSSSTSLNPPYTPKIVTTKDTIKAVTIIPEIPAPAQTIIIGANVDKESASIELSAIIDIPASLFSTG